VLPEGLGVSLDLAAIPVPPVFGWLAATGNVAEREMLRTFNCGVGMIVVAEAARTAEVEAALKAAGESPVRMGEVVAFSGDEERVAYRGHLAL
jgi:phosphoribosylformylglycinamidine cyclo-ligase